MRAGFAAILLMLASGCSKPPPKPDPASLRVPVPAAELRRLLIGNFIDERPYPCDAGPLAIQRNGSFAWFSGWGTDSGTYAIADGVVTFTYTLTDLPKPPFSITFRKDGNGVIYFVRGKEPEHELRLAPVDEKTNTISCGDGGPPGDTG